MVTRPESYSPRRNSGELIGERDGEDVMMQPLLGRLEHGLRPWRCKLLGSTSKTHAAGTNKRSQPVSRLGRAREIPKPRRVIDAPASWIERSEVKKGRGSTGSRSGTARPFPL